MATPPKLTQPKLPKPPFPLMVLKCTDARSLSMRAMAIEENWAFKTAIISEMERFFRNHPVKKWKGLERLRSPAPPEYDAHGDIAEATALDYMGQFLQGPGYTWQGHPVEVLPAGIDDRTCCLVPDLGWVKAFDVRILLRNRELPFTTPLSLDPVVTAFMAAGHRVPKAVEAELRACPILLKLTWTVQAPKG